MVEKTIKTVCDRCGAEFKGYIAYDDDEVLEKEHYMIKTVKRRFALSRYKWHRFEYVDLCPKCAKELLRWMHKESETELLPNAEEYKVKIELFPNAEMDKIKTELLANAEMHEDGNYYLRDKWVSEIIDKYKAMDKYKVESEE